MEEGREGELGIEFPKVLQVEFGRMRVRRLSENFGDKQGRGMNSALHGIEFPRGKGGESSRWVRGNRTTGIMEWGRRGRFRWRAGQGRGMGKGKRREDGLIVERKRAGDGQ